MTAVAQQLPLGGAAANASTGRLTDARPVLERSGSNVWERVAERRSLLRRAIQEECEARRVEALVLESHPYVDPPWVKFESWVPVTDRTLTRRSSLTVTLTAAPYHLYDIVYKVEWTWQGFSGTVNHIHTLADADLAQIVTWLFGESNPGRRIARFLRKRQLRQNDLEFWRSKNKVTAFTTDLPKLLATSLIVAGIVAWLAPVGPLSPSYAFVKLGAIVAIIAGVSWRVRLRRGGHLVRSAGKPFREPRHLRHLDSWQTVVFDAGTHAEEIRQRLLARFSAPTQQQFAHDVERIWYWGLEGKEEREQIVLRYGRALVFVHIYRYGTDLYTGWTGELNVGQWIEKTLGRGVERATGKRVELKTVESGWQTVSEYDVIDLNCLAEWAHAQMAHVLRHYLSERAIDQEIDFTIIRGERKDVRDKEKKENPLKRFKRVA